MDHTMHLTVSYRGQHDACSFHNHTKFSAQTSMQCSMPPKHSSRTLPTNQLPVCAWCRRTEVMQAHAVTAAYAMQPWYLCTASITL